MGLTHRCEKPAVRKCFASGVREARSNGGSLRLQVHPARLFRLLADYLLQKLDPLGAEFAGRQLLDRSLAQGDIELPAAGRVAQRDAIGDDAKLAELEDVQSKARWGVNAA